MGHDSRSGRHGRDVDSRWPRSPSVEPQNPDAEDVVIGVMMLAASAIDGVVPILDDGAAFYPESRRRIYQSALELRRAGEPGPTGRPGVPRGGRRAGRPSARLGVLR
jgi:hypothetical protein